MNKSDSGVLADELLDFALRVFAPDGLRLDPVWSEVWSVFLKERLAVDAIWIARKHHGSTPKVGQDPVHLEAKVVVHPACRLLLNHEDTGESGGRFAKRLACPARTPLPAIVV